MEKRINTVPTEIINPSQLIYGVHKTDFERKKIHDRVFDLLAQYPQQFVPGLSDDYIQADFESSWVITGSMENGTIVGSIMFDPEINEYNWLAVDKGIQRGKRYIAKALFETVYPHLPANTTVMIKPNTEDAYHPELSINQFHGQHFAPARNLYENIMGLPLLDENREENAYGEGQHVYKVEWVVNKQENS